MPSSPRRPLLLLPPSKGKVEGGGGPPYGATLDDGDAVVTARRVVLEALVAAAPGLGPRQLSRVCGIPARAAEAQRDVLVGLASAPTLPARQRYHGIVHRNAGLCGTDPRTAAVDVRIVSALLGLAALDDPVPAYRLEVAATLPGFGGLGTWWREHLADHLLAIGAGVPVWDLLPGEHQRVWDPRVREALDVRVVRFVRPDGRAANAARTKVCKGRLAACLIRTPGLDARTLAREVDPGEGWTLQPAGEDVTATYAG